MRHSQSSNNALRMLSLFLLCSISGCGGQILKVILPLDDRFPENPIQVLLLLNGRSARQRLSIPWISEASLGHTFSFNLQLPANAVGELEMAIAHFGTNGCLLRTDTTSLIIQGGDRTQNLQAPSFGLTGFILADQPGRPMTPYWHPMVCPVAEQIPVLAFVEASTSTPFRPGGTLTIDGWGLLPGCTFTINGLPAEVVHWYSPLRVEVRVPPEVSAIPPIAITVQNPDGESDTRTDLIRSM